MSGPVKVDRAALAAAVAPLKEHMQLLIESYMDLIDDHDDDRAVYARGAVRDVIAAIDHVVDDDFRSLETRGGS